MTRIKLYNARILDVKKMNVFEGEIHVQDNLIEYVGKNTEDKNFDKFINCHGNLLMPGFKNAHTHSGMSFLRSYCDDVELHEWLFNKVLPLEDKLTGDDIYWLSKLSILEYLQSGITTNFDMYNKPFHIAKASVEMGYRTVITGCINYFGDTKYEFIRMYNDMNSIDPLITYKLGFHSVYTISEEYLKTLALVSQELDQPVYAHMSETATEVRECREKHNGKTPFEYINDLGLLEHGGGFYHCVHLSENDCKIIKNKKLSVVTCPASNAKLASGMADLYPLMKNGVTIGIGTDGPASNNSLDMFKEMFLVSAFAKLKNNDPIAIKAKDIIRMATINGAKIMGLDDACCLEPGQLADIIMIDLHQPNMQPYNNLISNLVYAGNKLNIRMTMVNGKVLYSNGIFNVGIEPDEIYAKCKEIALRVQDNKNK